VDLRLSVQSDDGTKDWADLLDWLRREPALRGHVHAQGRPQPGDLGATVDTLLVAASSGGLASVLATSLGAWLGQPRKSDVRITIETNGRRVEVDAKRVDDIAPLITSLTQPD
jgi:hypothetical protein